MTASKSSRARNARPGSPAGAAGGSAARNRANRNGTAVKASSAKGNPVMGNPGKDNPVKGNPGKGSTAKGSTVKGSTAKDGGVGGRAGGRAGTGGVGGRAGGRAGTAVAARGDAQQRVTRGRAAEEEFGGAPVRSGVPLWMQLTTFLLSVAGLGVSVYLTIAHYTESSLAGCSESGLVNCTKVTTSAQSRVFGIPVAVLGLAFFVFAVAIMSPWAWRSARREIHLVRIASLVAGIGFVLYLLYAELYIIGSICLYCTSVHVITFVLFVLTVFAAAFWGLTPTREAS